MGCSPYKKKPTITRKDQKNLIILPGTFMKMINKSFTDVYDIGKSLGSGAYAEVLFCTHKANKIPRAVKMINKQFLHVEALKEQFIKEVEILKLLDHPNIVRAFEFFEDNEYFYIVMEHLKGGELFDEIIKQKQFTEFQAAQIVKQIFSCLNYLHGIGVVHRDLKPENLLLEEENDLFNLKLIDFGVAERINQNGITGLVGTPSYLAPEVIKGRYNERCDVWSAGVIMYILLTGYPPFQADSQDELYQLIQKYDYILNDYGWESISKEAKDLVKKIFVPEKSRISAEKALKHKWIVSQSRYEKQNETGLKSVLDKLIDFSGQNKLQEATKLFIITQLMSNKEIKETRDIFKQLDENGDGKLSREELINGYKKYIPVKSAEVLVDKIMKEVDTDDSGFIDYNEFLKAAIDIKSLSSPDYLQSAFNLFDRDGSGTISVDELKAVLQARNEDDARFNEILRQVDQNGDGVIDIQEFAAILKNMKVETIDNVINN